MPCLRQLFAEAGWVWSALSALGRLFARSYGRVSKESARIVWSGRVGDVVADVVDSLSTL
jgi:hypothetical protein